MSYTGFMQDENSSLSNLREEIDSIDKKLIQLLEQRLKVALKVAEVKAEQGLPLTHPQRERDLLNNLTTKIQNPYLKGRIRDLYTLIFNISKKIQAAYLHRAFVEKLKPASFGVLGYGHFGVLQVHILKEHWPEAKVLIYDPKHSGQEGFCDLKTVAQCDWIVPAVPIQRLRDTLIELSPYVRKESVLIDVCSVKVYPAMWMREILGDKIQLVASHPMFGPESTLGGTEFEDLNIMLHNINCEPGLYSQWTAFWKSLGVNVVEMSPHEHDRHAAYTINYNHFIGRVGELVGISPTPIDTKGFQVIYNALQYVTNDSWELFVQMQNYNPYSIEMRRKVLMAVQELETIVSGSPSMRQESLLW